MRTGRGLWLGAVLVVAGACSSAAPAAEVDTQVRPVVSVPSALPQELAITDLASGEGREAQVGDMLVVDYVGARTVNGDIFDNSWDRGEPFTLVLGSGGVIAGWDQGLVGVRQGARRQLDIPATLAYGDRSPGGIIEAGDALSFVIDVRAVVAATKPTDAPQVEIPRSSGASELSVVDLVVGDGRASAAGDRMLAHLLVYRGDTGELLDTTWEAGAPASLVLAEDRMIEGLYQSLLNARQGTRRLVTMPFDLAFGAPGNADLGLPPETDLVLVIDVLAVF